MKPGIKVFAPATISNVSIGFDILGFALEAPGDEVLVKEGNQKGLVISEIKGGKKQIPLDIHLNTAGLAAYTLLQHLGETNRPIEMVIHKKMGIGSGLGSSGASAVAGVFAVNEWLRTGLSKMDLLPFAMKGEKLSDITAPADNVAPSLLGGMILIRDNDTLDLKKLPVPAGLYIAVIYPDIIIKTKDSRVLLPKEVELEKVIKQQGNLGAFISSMYTSDFDMMGRCLHDDIIEPHRASGIPHFYRVKSLAMETGALGYSISGSGPSMFAICNSSFIAEEITTKISAFYQSQKINCKTYLSKINSEGAVVL